MFAMGGAAGNRGGDELPLVFATEPLTGFRTWRVSNKPGELTLRSLSMAYTWRVENTAECIRPGHSMPNIPKHDEESPGLECACGLYAQLPDHPLTEWTNPVRSMVRAVGTIAMSGRIIQCEKGYKAQHATIQSPVILEAGCVKAPDCQEKVVKLMPLPIGQYKGYCEDHFASEVQEERKHALDAEAWMAVACRELAEGYEGVEFFSWYSI